MMLLIFICPALQNPHSARRGATKASELFGGCCRPGGGPAVGGTLKARGAGGGSSCGGPKGKKKNGRNRGSKANNPPYLPPEVST